MKEREEWPQEGVGLAEVLIAASPTLCVQLGSPTWGSLVSTCKMGSSREGGKSLLWRSPQHCVGSSGSHFGSTALIRVQKLRMPEASSSFSIHDDLQLSA